MTTEKTTTVRIIVHKLIKVETYANLKMFFGIFGKRDAYQLWLQFKNQQNCNILDFYNQLTDDQRDKLADYINTR